MSDQPSIISIRPSSAKRIFFTQLEFGDYGRLKTVLYKPSKATETQEFDSSRPSSAWTMTGVGDALADEAG